MSLEIINYALAAVEHAAEKHRITLDRSNLSAVDVILNSERELGSVQDRDAVLLCYGAWFGEFLRTAVNGQWVGLSEPVPPRIRIRGVDYSPLDAVRRRITEASSPSLTELFEQVKQRSCELFEAESAIQQNRAAWERFSDDPRFAASPNQRMHRSEAIAAMDPWLSEHGSLEGMRVLCLAAGGGTHAPLLAVAGAKVTVVDFSASLLAIDQQIAQSNGLAIETLETSMDDLTGLQDASFDCVVQPVSSCYIPDVGRVYAEVHRVLKPNGIYLAQHKHPASLQSDSVWGAVGYGVRVASASGLRLPDMPEYRVNREPGTVEYLHTLDALLGVLCRQGFVIEDFQEPPRADAWAEPGSAEHRAGYLPPYFKIKARRKP